MKLKICGLREPKNIAEVAALAPDYMGFIFYEGSPRYAGGLSPDTLRRLPSTIRRIGVFVDATESEIVPLAARYVLDGIQLHGSEPPELCWKLNRILPVIKAIPVGSPADLDQADRYDGCCSALLFDTRHELRGGSGVQFDWALLESYTGTLPFLLSGGIGPGDLPRIQSVRHPQLGGIDVNSRFETAPGLKDIALLKTFTEQLKHIRI